MACFPKSDRAHSRLVTTGFSVRVAISGGAGLRVFCAESGVGVVPLWSMCVAIASCGVVCGRVL